MGKYNVVINGKHVQVPPKGEKHVIVDCGAVNVKPDQEVVMIFGKDSASIEVKDKKPNK